MLVSAGADVHAVNADGCTVFTMDDECISPEMKQLLSA